MPARRRARKYMRCDLPGTLLGFALCATEQNNNTPDGGNWDSGKWGRWGVIGDQIRDIRYQVAKKRKKKITQRRRVRRGKKNPRPRHKLRAWGTLRVEGRVTQNPGSRLRRAWGTRRCSLPHSLAEILLVG
jgi:hypothetical protein